MIIGHLNLKGRNSAKSKNKVSSAKSKIKKWKIVMKLHSDIINKDFDEKVKEVDIVEEILIFVGFLQLCQLFHQNLC